VLILASWVSVRVTLLAVDPDAIDPFPTSQPTKRHSPEPVLHAALTANRPSTALGPLNLAKAPDRAPPHRDIRSWIASATLPNLLRKALAAPIQWRGYPAAGPEPGAVAGPEGASIPNPVFGYMPESPELSGTQGFRNVADAQEPGERSRSGPMRPRLLAQLPPTLPQSEPRHQPRWSADGWVLARGGQSAPALASGAAAYGGSQAGAVLRYALAPSSPLRPQLYGRVATALADTVRDREAALGLALRPLRHVPVAVMGEVRVQDSGGPVRARPVIMAVSELAPIRLPLGAEAEIYGEAGWAGGRGATAFYDAAGVVEHSVIRPLPGADLRLGGGLWTGGQRGAARLDLGPRIELRGAIGKPGKQIGVRLAVDWRFRVAGRAEPGSGPAITLAAGF